MLALLVVAGLLQDPQVSVPAVCRSDDWISTGHDCVAFGAGDLDGDGRAAILTINGNGQLCAARSVQGWKAANWAVLREGLAGGAVSIHAGDFDEALPGCEIVVCYADRAVLYGGREDGRLPVEREFTGDIPAPASGSVAVAPPCEPEAARHCSVSADVDGDGRADAITVFTAHRPHAHRIVRVAIAVHDGEDRDGDGVSDAREAGIGSDPLDRDSDDDGLLDGWEVDGLPRDVTGYDGTLSPLHRDVLLAVSRYEDLDEATATAQVDRARAVYAAIPTQNVDGTMGIALHVKWTDPVPKAGFGAWWTVGDRMLRREERGLAHWLQITTGGGGQAQQTGDMGGAGAHWAAFAHELGHQLSLSHEGDSAPAWCPLYPSLMNYAFNYQLGGDGNAIRFSDGRFASVELLETALPERLPFPLAELKYLQAAPFRFTLAADGEGATRIDWNHDARFDEGLVEADVNYGGSTYCGIRRNAVVSPAAPGLCVLDGVVQLVSVDARCQAIEVRACRGDGEWSEPRVIPNSATRLDPVAVGLGDTAFVFFRMQRAWCVARVTKDAIDSPIELPELGTRDLSAGAIAGRVLVVTRADDDVLAARWFDWAAEKKLGPAQSLAITSHVPPGLAQSPAGRVVLATSALDPKGHDWHLRATDYAIDGDALHELDSRWTRGVDSVNHCTTRPVVAFRGEELNLFHTGWFDGNGLTTAWRTRAVGNRSLDDGWLTCLLYDQWTLTRVSVAFAEGNLGAVYAYRWDPGDHGDMKVNTVQTAHNGWGIDAVPMRDFDDCRKITQWGIRHSILLMR